MNQMPTDSLPVERKLMVGVDTAKAEFAVGTIWQEVYHYRGKRANHATSIAEFIGQLEARRQEVGAEAIHLIIEPTGGYEAQLVAAAYAQGWRVTLVNPLHVRHWHKGSGKRGKADKIDTQMLTSFGADKNPPAQQPTDEAAAELDSLLRRKDDLQHLLHGEYNRREQAQLHPQTPKAVHRNIQRMIEALEQALAEIEQARHQLFAEHVHLARQLKQLLTVPGVGKKSAPYFLALFHRFQARTSGSGTSKQVVAFVGLDPQPFESGDSVYKRPTISRQGHADMRTRLFLCALGGVRGKNRLKQIYASLLAKGKAKKLALVACARKTLVWAWAVFSQDTTFDSSHFANA